MSVDVSKAKKIMSDTQASVDIPRGTFTSRDLAKSMDWSRKTAGERLADWAAIGRVEFVGKYRRRLITGELRRIPHYKFK